MYKCKPGSPAAKLMRGHHASGGEATPLPSRTKVESNPSNHYADGGMLLGRTAPNLAPKYRKGGHPTRRRAAGGHLPELEAMHPMAADKLRRGGRAYHAEGEEVEVKRKRGGRTHRQSREHHFIGSLVGALAPTIVGGLGKLLGFSHGGSARYAEGEEVKRRRGGRAYHAEGEEVKRAAGGVGKRRKHYPYA